MNPEEIANATLQERLDLARSPDSDDEILMQLALDKTIDIRRALTEREGLSEQLMQQLVKDTSTEIRFRMAKHPELTIEFQKIFAKCKDESIHATLARRDNVSEDILLKLAKNGNWHVGMALVSREILSEELLVQLMTIKNEYVQAAIAERDDLPEYFINEMLTCLDSKAKIKLAQRESLRPEVISILAGDDNDLVRAAVAARSDISESMIETFAADNSLNECRALLRRGDLSEQLYQQLSRQLINDIGDINDLLLYIEEECQAHLILTIEGRKLVFENGDYNLDDIGYERLRQLLPILFLHPESRKIQQIEMQIDGYGYYDEKLDTLSVLAAEEEIKRISLVTKYGALDYYDLSMSFCRNLGVISKENFPNLEYISVEGTLDEFKLDFPKLHEMSILSSGNDFHELILMLMKSNLPNLEILAISAGYDVGYARDHQAHKMKFYLEHAHKSWPHLKSLTVGARFAYDWKLLLTSPLFRQLDKLTINLDDPFLGTDDAKTMWSSVTNLIDALIDQSNYLSNIGAVTVGIGDDFECEAYNLRIDGQKLSQLKQLYNFRIEYSAYVAGHE